MAIALGNSAQGSSSSNTATTSSITTTGGSGTTFVIVATLAAGTTPTSATDSKGNTYTIRGTPASQPGTGCKVVLYTSENGTGGSGHTFTFTASGTAYPYVFGFEVIGTDTGSAIDVVVLGGDAASPFTLASGTLSQANEMLVSGVNTNSGSNPATYAPGTGWTIIQQGTNGASFWSGACAYKIVSTTASDTTLSWTAVGGTGGNLVLVGIKEGSVVTDTLMGQCCL